VLITKPTQRRKRNTKAVQIHKNNMARKKQHKSTKAKALNVAKFR